MSHPPVENHPLRPLHRAAAALTGAFLALFGALGVVGTASEQLFARLPQTALGIKTNLAFSAFALVAGLLALLAVAVGRNVDARVNKWLGYLLLIAGSVMLGLMQTEGNLFNATVTGVVVVYLAGTVLLVTGLYSRVARAA